MTIVKRKNPVLRCLAGLVTVAAMVVVAAIILYALGCIVKKIPFSFFPFNMCRDIANMGWFGTISSSGILLGYLFLAIVIIGGFIKGTKAIGEKFFDP